MNQIRLGGIADCRSATHFNSANFVIHIGKNQRCTFEPSIRLYAEDMCWVGLEEAVRKANSTFTQIFDEIDERINRGEKILIHCSGGVTRSPSLLIAYLMRKEGIDYDRAYEIVKESRPQIEIYKDFELGIKQIFN